MLRWQLAEIQNKFTFLYIFNFIKCLVNVLFQVMNVFLWFYLKCPNYAFSDIIFCVIKPFENIKGLQKKSKCISKIKERTNSELPEISHNLTLKNIKGNFSLISKNDL